MRECHYDFLAYVGQTAVLSQSILQTIPIMFPTPEVAHDDKVRNDEQEYGRSYESGYETEGMSLRLGEFLFPILKRGLCLPVKLGNE